MSATLEIAYGYLDEIKAYLAGTLSEEGTDRMLIGMLNDGIAWQLTGPLKEELERRLASGEIQSRLQHGWDDNSDAVAPWIEKVYVTRAVGEMMDRCDISEGNS